MNGRICAPGEQRSNGGYQPRLAVIAIAARQTFAP